MYVTEIIIICSFLAAIAKCLEGENIEKILNQSHALRDPFNVEETRWSKCGSEVKLGDLPHHVLIFRKYIGALKIYRAFCAGSIIGESKVITSAHCFLTNRKNPRRDDENTWVVAGIIQVTVQKNDWQDKTQQWRNIAKILSQRFYRYPGYNLAVLIVNKPWVFNNYINKIPYESTYHDFDGVCIATVVKPTKSWSIIKYVFIEQVEMISRKKCEKILQRSCSLYFCTANDERSGDAFSETEGGGLVCFETGDPSETDPKQGILVGVTSVINVGLPNLYSRIGNHANWVKNQGYNQMFEIFLLALCIPIMIINNSTN